MMQAPPPSSVPLTKIELQFQCEHLKNKDVMSKSDPQVFVFLQPPRTSNWIEIGKTEMVKDNLSPKFATSVIVDYYFEEVQNLRFLVVDVDKPNKGWEHQEPIGQVECALGSIVGARGSQVTKELHEKEGGKKVTGKITIIAEEVQEMRTTVVMRFSARKLDKKDFFGKSDPYLVISKSKEDGSWVKVHQTEVIMKTLDPTWKPIEIHSSKLNGGDADRPILIECFDWDKNSDPDFIGNCKTTLRALQATHELPLKDPKKESKKGYANSGTLIIDGIELRKEHSFIDYLAGGCEISLIVAVDFTSSNGDPKYTNSLHYRNPYQPNEYERAIMGVGEILGNYDSDGNYPVYGFGGKVGWNNWQISHCFPLNGNAQNPEVHGVAGILDVYRRSLDNVQLWGPTNFSNVISASAYIAGMYTTQQNQKYSILMILTDGEITDMDNTIAEIVKASALPLSIIIVGVGSADFKNMNILDGDDKALSSNGKKAERDIVQFVPFRDYKDQHPSMLAASTLAEVPGQLISWMKSRGITPNPPRTAVAPAPVAAPAPVTV